MNEWAIFSPHVMLTLVVFCFTDCIYFFQPEDGAHCSLFVEIKKKKSSKPLLTVSQQEPYIEIFLSTDWYRDCHIEY